jgi:4-hydroxyphenylpyruvate dioxygenase
LLCTPFTGAIGPGELAIPAVAAPDGSLLYFCDPARDGRPAFEMDFMIERAAGAPLGARARVDHITRALPPGQLEPWLLFQRSVLGLLSQRNVILHDPYGAVRSREFESSDKAIRTSLVVSERDNTAVARSIARYGGAGVQQMAIAVDDVIALAAELRRRGAPLLPVPDNYYDDLDAKYALEPSFLRQLRASGVLYERDDQGEFLHVYAAPFEDRFEFEFIERRGGYQLYGSTNAPVRLAALAEWRATRDRAARP